MEKIDEILGMKDRKLAYYSLVSFFENASEEERNLVRELWDFGEVWIYPDWETLTYNLAGEPSCEERIFTSVMYNAISDAELHIDYRDVLVSLGYEYHCALAVGLDPKKIFERVARCASDEMAKFLLDFINRTDEQNSLKSWCLKKITTELGPKIIHERSW